MEMKLSPGWLGKDVQQASAVSIDERLKEIDADRKRLKVQFDQQMAELDRRERLVLGLKV